MTDKFSSMINLKTFAPYLLVLLFFGCGGNTDYCLPVGDIDNLIGNWQVYERGYSPGAGYIVEEVPDEPVQILSFETNNKFSSNYQGLVDYSYYQIITDDDEHILALYKRKRDIKNDPDTGSLEHSYLARVEDGQVKLYFRFCIEGCHIGIRRQN